MDTIQLSETFPCDPELIFDFFMDSKLHSEITGAEALIENKIGGKFSAWDNYIEGRTTELVRNKKIIQQWRTRDFEASDADSTVEIIIEKDGAGKSKLTLKHSNLPEESGPVYKKGWRDFYLDPFRRYLVENRDK